MTQSAQQAQSKEDNTYIAKSSRQSNAPILITIVALLRHVGYGHQWGSSRTVSVRTNRVRNKHKARSIILILININLCEEDRRIGLSSWLCKRWICSQSFKGFFWWEKTALKYFGLFGVNTTHLLRLLYRCH